LSLIVEGYAIGGGTVTQERTRRTLVGVNNNAPRDVPLSMLDLSTLADGTTSSDALNTTTLLAQRAEQLGFTRFWVAEHHNGPSVACTSPAVLIAHLAAHTERIRVGE
jgi:hypothetical protein